MKCIVHVRFPDQDNLRTWAYRAYYSNPQVGDTAKAPPASTRSTSRQMATVVEVVQLPQNSAATQHMRVAILHKRASPDTDTRLHSYAAIDLSRGAQAPHLTNMTTGDFVPTTQQEKHLMDDSYTCSKGLIENPTADNAELIEKHEAAIAAIKAREKAARKAAKAERKAEREHKQRIKERAERRELALQTLADIANTGTDANRIAAATALFDRA